jgi:DNA-directed RNA polymerase subunit M/transcription elongation factor TFIIS
MHFCPECNNICTLYDDISLKKIYNVCMHCNYKNELDNPVIYSKTFNKIKTATKISSILHHDAALPSSSVRTCGKCNGNDTLFIRNTDLTLDFLCKKCNELITS